MQQYILDHKLEKAEDATGDSLNHELKIFIIKSEEVPFETWNKDIISSIMRDSEIHFSKVEEVADAYIGSLRIPTYELERHHHSFQFVIQKEQVVFVDDSDEVLQYLDIMATTRVWKSPDIGVFFTDFLETVAKDDILFLEHMENSLQHMEELGLENKWESDFNQNINSIRRKILKFSHYYLQLEDLATNLVEDDGEILGSHYSRGMAAFLNKIGRLREETLMLRDYSIQVREMYHSNIDERRNEIMKVLTIVTTIVLPLTLITGWYGMNFYNMPELAWKYGYVMIIFISILVVGWCIWLFKRKKFW